jgi:undecaprenyl-phosphate 4-deoxy-4-formamido-L-arabinose transferase
VLKLATTTEIPAGWPSLMVVFLLGTGAILFSLGVIAEYIGVSVNMAMGKPPYLIVSDPADGPFGRPSAASAVAVNGSRLPGPSLPADPAPSVPAPSVPAPSVPAAGAPRR